MSTSWDYITRHVHPAIFAFAAGALTVSLYNAVQRTRDSNANFGSPSPITPSPLKRYSTDRNASQLAYPPAGLLPGARDVSSPYGTMRVYEFGPETATRRIVLLHGISTPCISLFRLASHLATLGARVMLLDLFGRGWSDAPTDLPHDGRLYATQIMLALTSSSVPWTGNGARFALAGYSLGGGLAADFCAWFPELVSELILLAPGGLLREVHISWRSKMMYYSRGFFPESWSLALVGKYLRSTPNVTNKPPVKQAGSEKNVAPSAEVPANAVLETANGAIDMEAAVDWQIDNNDAFAPAFVSCIRHCPIQRQHKRWQWIGERARARKQLLRALGGQPASTSEEARVLRQGLESGQVQIFLGGKDLLVRANEVGPDASAALGEDEANIVVVEDAGHELPITHAVSVAERIWVSWAT